MLPHFSDIECRCCREIPESRGVADSMKVQCVTEIADFEQAILNPLTLFQAWGSFTEKYRQDTQSRGLAERGQEEEEENEQH